MVFIRATKRPTVKHTNYIQSADVHNQKRSHVHVTKKIILELSVPMKIIIKTFFSFSLELTVFNYFVRYVHVWPLLIACVSWLHMICVFNGWSFSRSDEDHLIWLKYRVNRVYGCLSCVYIFFFFWEIIITSFNILWFIYVDIEMNVWRYICRDVYMKI